MMNVLLMTFIVLLMKFIVCEEHVSIWNENIIWEICLNVVKYDMLYDDCDIICLTKYIIQYIIHFMYIYLFIYHVLWLYISYILYNVSYNLKKTSLQPVLLSILQS